jgi:hypothetical protein
MQTLTKETIVSSSGNPATIASIMELFDGEIIAVQQRDYPARENQTQDNGTGNQSKQLDLFNEFN